VFTLPEFSNSRIFYLLNKVSVKPIHQLYTYLIKNTPLVKLDTSGRFQVLLLYNKKEVTLRAKTMFVFQMSYKE
jgi:hypothetical protein